MAVNRRSRRFLHDSLMEPGISSILTSGTLKAGNGFVRTRQMTGLEKENGRPGVCGRIPILLQRELSALYSGEFKTYEKGKPGRGRAACRADP